MSALLFFADVCATEEQVDSIFYHKRRDWERRHLRWKQDMEKIRRTGRRRAYAEPVAPSIERIRKEVYRRL
jgi:pyridoxine 5'-phosphate synthase PdxJ